jgi:6-pyruvoyltetrahydropterin/6-carboxytetrahydropterin synthase
MHAFVATRKIGIDAAHRVSSHGSKCRNLHGHRYEIEASCEAGDGRLRTKGQQLDMVVDFSFLKEEMINHIENKCDHGLIVAISDEDLLKVFCPQNSDFTGWLAKLKQDVESNGFSITDDTKLKTRLYVIAYQPTAERLAEHWFECLEKPIAERSQGRAKLRRIRVWETPNCYADYYAPKP